MLLAPAYATETNGGTSSPSDQFLNAPLSPLASTSAPETNVTVSYTLSSVLAVVSPDVSLLSANDLQAPERTGSLALAYGPFNPWSCVSYVKFRRPDQTEPWGSPSRIKVYDISPVAGLIVVTREGPVGHAAYIEAVTDDTLIVSEANFVPGKVTRREIPIDDPLIRGYR